MFSEFGFRFFWWLLAVPFLGRRTLLMALMARALLQLRRTAWFTLWAGKYACAYSWASDLRLLPRPAPHQRHEKQMQTSTNKNKEQEQEQKQEQEQQQQQQQNYYYYYY